MKAPRSYAEWVQQMTATEAEAARLMKIAPPEQYEARYAWWLECQTYLEDMLSDRLGYTVWCLAENNPDVLRPVSRFTQ